MESESSNKANEVENESVSESRRGLLLKRFRSLGPFFGLTGNMLVGAAGTAAFLILFFDIAPYVDLERQGSFGTSIGNWLLLLPSIALAMILLHAVTKCESNKERVSTSILGGIIIGVMIVVVYEPLVEAGVSELAELQAEREREMDGNSDLANMHSKLEEMQKKVEGLESELSALRTSIESNPAFSEANDDTRTFVLVSAREGDTVDLQVGGRPIMATAPSTAAR